MPSAWPSRCRPRGCSWPPAPSPTKRSSRIEQHRQARRDRGWETVEEQCDLADVFRRHGQHNVLLVDCVTLWINNLMYHAEREGRPLTEADVAQQCRQVLDAAEACPGTVIFVTNEVGLGVVPENAQARRYRDLVGRANQILAARADTVTLLCCGIPVAIERTPIEDRYESHHLVSSVDRHRRREPEREALS